MNYMTERLRRKNPKNFMNSLQFPRQMAMMAAMAANRVIGRENRLPWRLPGDLQRVKKLTLGKALLMGRKTYESIGRPLPGRLNIVLTHQPDYRAEGCVVVATVEAGIAAAYAYAPDQEIIIFGGATLYERFLPQATRLYLTILDEPFVGDAYFPEFDYSDWQEVLHERFPMDEKNPYAYTFVILERK